MRIRPLTASIGAAVLIAATLTACGGSSGDSSGGGAGGDKKPYEVGFSTDLSGAYSGLGTGQRDGFQAYIKYVNANGGVNGHKINVTVADDAADIARGSANETQFIAQNKAIVTVGWPISNVCGAVATIATTRKVPLICSALADDLLNPVHPYVYSGRISQSNQALPMVTYAATLANKPNPKIAVIGYGSAASMVLEANLAKIAAAKGMDVVANQNVPFGSSDTSAQTAKVIAGKPDVVVGALPDAMAVNFMRSLKAADLNVPFLTYDGATLEAGLLAAKDPNLYVLSGMTLTGEGTGEGLATYKKALEAAGASPTKPFVNVGYVQALEVVEGLRACGDNCDGEKLQKAFDGLKYDTGGVTSGPIQYTSDNHLALREVSFYHWDPAKSAVVEAVGGLKGGSTA